jgi:hypothetical protein
MGGDSTETLLMSEVELSLVKDFLGTFGTDATLRAAAGGTRQFAKSLDCARLHSLFDSAVSDSVTATDKHDLVLL